MSDDRKYAQVAVESIQCWAETVGISELGHETARSLASDATYRLHQVLDTCGQLLRYSKRRRLTTDDFNRALKWMDVSTVHGYSGNENIEWVSIPEVGAHVPHDPPVNLASTALSGDIFHQPGSPCVRGEWCHISSHIVKSEVVGGNGGDCNLAPLPLSPEHAQYYHALFNTITGPSNTQFKIMYKDLCSSSHIGSLVGPVVGGLIRGVQRARQKPHILRRLLLTTQALLHNPHLHLGPQNYIRDIVDGVLMYCIVTERKNSRDTQIVRSLAANILLKVIGSEEELGIAWETSVSNLEGVILNNTQRWGQHVGALMGLLTLGPTASHQVLVPCARMYYNRIVGAQSLITKDGIDAYTAFGLLLACFVNITVGLIKELPIYFEVFSKKGDSTNTILVNEKKNSQNVDTLSNDDLAKCLIEVYEMSEAMFGPAYVLQLPTIYLCFKKEDCPNFMNSSIYKEQAVTGETLLREMMTSPPPQNKQRTSYKPKLPAMSSHKRIHISPLQVFDSYRQVIPRNNRYLQISLPGCHTWSFGQLRRRSSTMPRVTTNTKPYISQKLTDRMPHATFTKPLNSSLKPGYSLNFLIL